VERLPDQHLVVDDKHLRPHIAPTLNRFDDIQGLRPIGRPALE
jgi:hypothetical protein